MLTVSKIDTYGFAAAIRGMRNPMNSWEKSDSMYHGLSGEYHLVKFGGHTIDCFIELRTADLELMHKLYCAGPEHRKFMRFIHVTMDITAPLYWWKQFDTYKVGTVANSCSTMHKIQAKEFESSDFSMESFTNEALDIDYWTNGIRVSLGRISLEDHMTQTVALLNALRKKYLETKDRDVWLRMIQLLPSSYNQLRTVDFNYEVAENIRRQRNSHKLDEWHQLIDILAGLPYMNAIMYGVKGDSNGTSA